jgi:hypothetical protein
LALEFAASYAATKTTVSSRYSRSVRCIAFWRSPGEASTIAKNQVRGFYKLYRQVERQGEITDLERQWNGR